jgi:hypothetical protein
MLMFLMMSGKRTALSIGHSRKNLTMMLLAQHGAKYSSDGRLRL